MPSYSVNWESKKMNKQIKDKICRGILRLLQEDDGFAMEYIVITLLVASSVVGLVMVFSGNLRNMLGNINATIVATSVDELNDIAESYDDQSGYWKEQNRIAISAGNKLGGDFSSGTASEETSGNTQGTLEEEPIINVKIQEIGYPEESPAFIRSKEEINIKARKALEKALKD